MSSFSVLSFDFQLQSFLQIIIFQIRIDECPSSGCAGASGCTNVLNVRDTPMVVDCGTMSLVSLTLESTAVCSCPGRDQSHQPCSAYPRNPCFNGGVCVDTQHGYRWVKQILKTSKCLISSYSFIRHTQSTREHFCQHESVFIHCLCHWLTSSVHSVL